MHYCFENSSRPVSKLTILYTTYPPLYVVEQQSNVFFGITTPSVTPLKLLLPTDVIPKVLFLNLMHMKLYLPFNSKIYSFIYFIKNCSTSCGVPCIIVYSYLYYTVLFRVLDIPTQKPFILRRAVQHCGSLTIIHYHVAAKKQCINIRSAPALQYKLSYKIH